MCLKYEKIRRTPRIRTTKNQDDTKIQNAKNPDAKKQYDTKIPKKKSGRYGLNIPGQNNQKFVHAQKFIY